MASTKRGSRSQPLALELLSTDHRKVEAMFDRYEEMVEEDDVSRIALAQRICMELTVHALVEEELFYPWLRENLDDMHLLEEAYVEHKSAKQLIAEIEAQGEVDETYDAKVKVLGEYIKHHVKEEEDEIFPKVSSETEELDELGQELAARKAELMMELGLDKDEEEGAMEAGAMQGGRRKQSQQGARNAR